LSKRFGSIAALEEVDFALFPGQVHALVGENGAGKSTLIHLLVGALQPDSGNIFVGGRLAHFRDSRQSVRAGIAAVFQELSLISSLSVAENIFVTRQPTRFGFVRKTELMRRASGLIDSFALDLDPARIVSSLSLAERQVVEILKCLAANPCVVLLDEPTSSLTHREKEILFRLIERLREDKRAILYISHHLPEILELADCATVLRDGRAVGFLKRDALTEPNLTRLMVGRELDDIYEAQRGKVASAVPRLAVTDLNCPGIFEQISFDVGQGEIVGVAGLVGAGRSNVGLALGGIQPADSGEIRLDGKKIWPESPRAAMAAGLVYLPEDRKTEGLFLRQSIRDNLVAPQLARFAGKTGFLSESDIDDNAAAACRESRVSAQGIWQAVGRLSGGNQQKILLAARTRLKPKVLIADEPTRGVDVGARVEIYQQLRRLTAEGASVLLISSDLLEILGLSDRILVMRSGRIVARFLRRDATEQQIIAAALGVSIASALDRASSKDVRA